MWKPKKKETAGWKIKTKGWKELHSTDLFFFFLCPNHNFIIINVGKLQAFGGNIYNPWKFFPFLWIHLSFLHHEAVLKCSDKNRWAVVGCATGSLVPWSLYTDIKNVSQHSTFLHHFSDWCSLLYAIRGCNNTILSGFGVVSFLPHKQTLHHTRSYILPCIVLW